MKERNTDYLACSNCFNDEGLKLDAFKIGFEDNNPCPNCNNNDGRKLNIDKLYELADMFYVAGSVFRADYGGSNTIQFNDYHFGKDTIHLPQWLMEDTSLFRKFLKIGLFDYGPPLWKVGVIGPLEELQDENKKALIIEKIVTLFPGKDLPVGTQFYRLRVNPAVPLNIEEYDSPPDQYLESGRLDSRKLPILYGSWDLEACLHECKVTIEDNLYLSKLSFNRATKLLDLTEWISEEGITQFESINLAIHMLFRAPSHSYGIIRDIAAAAKQKGYEGLIYPSYYNQIHFKGAVQNIGLFGRPIKDNLVEVKCIDRVILQKVNYDYHFGPASA